MNLEILNKELAKLSPKEIVQWVFNLDKKTIITTNFRPYEVAILHLTSQEKSDIKVVWCDTGYNTPQTYKHAEELIERLALNVDLYVPKQTVAHRTVTMGLPSVDDKNHVKFTEQVKLEPFKRAMKIHQPEIWFTNLRKGQTAFRDGIGVLSFSKDGILKVSPFYHWTDEDLDGYLKTHKLPNEFKYFDPTKVESNRECGLHI
ncbi:phosphoadenosine phosphosulfate reductase family protein [Tenacibaculum dicentrarchi]|nr:phosphoadenosine phosphosulfate reductase family protein [Tenacibaculum finnmarkense]MCG8825760.1 phosphoadenosine phosphosulfate reductase family protein [Tenacibaculum finnmarkense]MCG8827605.1 phosphoadenosine phosphosulfate reductase family protein [Tenacibaculum dicentrarchi]MCG8837986.1 phosphoadenosine phosphosulfate reductase family protein [Tenacibaculum dicentrarchi]